MCSGFCFFFVDVVYNPPTPLEGKIHFIAGAHLVVDVKYLSFVACCSAARRPFRQHS